VEDLVRRALTAPFLFDALLVTWAFDAAFTTATGKKDSNALASIFAAELPARADRITGFALANAVPIETLVRRPRTDDATFATVLNFGLEIYAALLAATGESITAREWIPVLAAVTNTANVPAYDTARTTNALPIYARFSIKARMSTFAAVLLVVLQAPAHVLALDLVCSARTQAVPTALAVRAAEFALATMSLVRLKIPASILVATRFARLARSGRRPGAAGPFEALSATDDPAVTTCAVAVDAGLAIVACVATCSAILLVGVTDLAAIWRAAMLAWAARHAAVTVATITLDARATANDPAFATRAVAIDTCFTAVTAIAAIAAVLAVSLEIRACLAAFVRPRPTAPLSLVLPRFLRV
jgi:hypothetical protein